MIKLLTAALFTAFCGSASAQMMQVIPASSTAAIGAFPISTAAQQQPLETADEPPRYATAEDGSYVPPTKPADAALFPPRKPAKSGQPSKPVQYDEARVPLSGLVLMPMAYRGRGKNSIGLGLDFNAAYYIGRLYGKNKYEWTVDKTNYLDRVGVWLLMADTKMLIQTEGKLRPAMAAGAQGILQFRDSPQPTLTQPGVSVKVNGKNTATYANAYLVLTKRLHRKLILNAGYSDGDMPKVMYQLSEFLSKEAIRFTDPRITDFTSPTGMLFGGIMWLPKPNSPIGVEFMIPQGAQQNPKLFNFHLGTLLKLNFEISYLTFRGGWDVLGMFQFRYGYLPK